MKKIFLSLLIFCFIVGLSANSATVNEDGIVNVYLNTYKELPPDNVQITFSVETYDIVFQKASDENKKISEGLYTKLNSLINKNRGDYIKTSNYTAKPIYTYKNNKKTFDKYIVSNSVTVFSKDVKSVSKLIDSATSLGITNVENLIFSVADYENQCNELLSDLTQKSQNRANAVVKPLNMRVIGIKNINATCSEESHNRNFYSAKAVSGSMQEDSTPIEQGKIKINANLNSSFYVK